jgi:hypothetical protein
VAPVVEDLGIISIINESVWQNCCPSITIIVFFRPSTSNPLAAITSTVTLEESPKLQRASAKRGQEDRQTSSSDSVGLQGSPKKRRRLFRVEHSYK